MKKIIAISIAIFLGLGSTVSSAAKCKWLADTVSYSTGEPVRWTRWVRNRAFYMGGMGYAAIAGVSEGEQKYLGLQVIAPDRKMATRPTKEDMDATFVVPAGSTLSILMADDSIFELVVPEDIIGDAGLKVEEGDAFDESGPKANSDGEYTIESYAVIKFPLDADAFAALSTQKASDLRLNANGVDYDFSFGKKPVDKIQKVLACVA
jgi:hypothetical protein